MEVGWLPPVHSLFYFLYTPEIFCISNGFITSR
jgi:hypothetical protein